MTNMYAAAAWMPWVGHFGHRTIADQSRRHALLWGCALALTVLAGSPEVTLMSLAVVPACAGDAALRARVRQRPGHTLALLAIAAALAVLLSAAQWVPTFDWLRQSERASLSTDAQRYWANHPFMLAQAVLPLSIDPLPISHGARQLLFEGREPFLYSIYMGGPLLALVLAGAWAGRGHRVGFALLAVLGILLSWGDLTPVYDVAAFLLPPVRLFRYPAKATLLAALAVAVLSGLGMDVWSERRRGGRLAWILGIGLPMAALAGLAWHLASPAAPVWRSFVGPPLDGGGYERYPEFVRMSRHLLVAGLFLFLAGVAAVTRAIRTGPAPVLSVLMAIIGIGDLVVHMRDLNPTVSRMLDHYRPRILAQIPRERPNRTLVFDYVDPVISQRLLGPKGDMWPVDMPPALVALNQRDYPRVLGAGLWGIEGFPVDVPRLRGREAADAARALQLGAAARPYGRLLRALGVQYVISLHDLNLKDELRLVATSPVPSPTRPTLLWMLPEPLPRAYWVGRARRGDELLDFVRRVFEDPSFDPLQEVLLPRADADLAPPMPNPALAPGSARILTLKPDAIEVETEAARDGYLVVTEGFAPGWRATVDGRPAPIVRANGLFRAVRVAAGRHRVTMRYRPPSIPIGVGLSLVGVLVAVASWTAAGARSRPDDSK